MRLRAEDITRIESEAGILATLVFHPEFSLCSENLLPNHFFNKENRYIYAAICNLAQRGIERVDAYSILESLRSKEGTAQFANELTIDQLHDFIENSENPARHTLEDYKLCVDNVMDAAFRRDTLQILKKCEAMCFNESVKEVEQEIYRALDDVMMEYSTATEVPQFKDVVDGLWEEIKTRQRNGMSGIPFKFPTLNQYVSIEPGELVVFAAEAKQGKSMMLLNCAVDLLKKGKKVLYIDSELNSRLFTCRLLSHLAKIEFSRVRSGKDNR